MCLFSLWGLPQMVRSWAGDLGGVQGLGPNRDQKEFFLVLDIKLQKIYRK